MEYLLGLIGLLVAALGYNVVKRRSAEALLTNNDVIKETLTNDKVRTTNEALIEAERQKITDAIAKAKTAKDANVEPGDFN